MSVKTIVIANIAEYNRRAMNKQFTSNEVVAWDDSSLALTDMSLFWSGDDKVVVLPKSPNLELLSDTKKALNYKNVFFVWPRQTTYSICEDIVHDKDLFALLNRIITDSNECQIVSWGSTPQFYDLLDKFRQADVTFRAPETPSRINYWTSLYLDSKAGFREFVIQKLPMLKIPEGYTCGNKRTAIDAISKFFFNDKGFVLKANSGTGGSSTMCYPANCLERGLTALQKNALRKMAFDHFWDSSPVIIEEYISGRDNRQPESLTVDMIISPNGTVKLAGAGKMKMRRESLYSGIYCGLGVLEERIEREIIGDGRLVGEAIAKMGYRGWFDIDFVEGKDGNLYLTEFNVRRTSPAHVFDIAKKIAGENWAKEKALFANDHFPLQGACQPRYSQIRKAFIEFNLQNRKRQAQAIPTIVSASLLQKAPYLGYVILAQDITSAIHFANQLECKIKSKVGMAL